MSAEVSTRILVLSDTHCAMPDAAGTNKQPFRWPLPKADVLLHAGDLTMNGSFNQHKKALDLIKGVEAELKIVIPGNHDLTLDPDYCRLNPTTHQGHGPNFQSRDLASLEAIRELYVSHEAKADNVHYIVEGTRKFKLSNGASFTLYASAWQPEFDNWAFNYPREQDRFNPPTQDSDFEAPNPISDTGIDIVVTHGPPYGILDTTSRGEDVGCVHLRRAVDRCKPQLHVFGHIHEGWGAIKLDWSKKEELGDVEVDTQDELVERMGAFYDGTQLEKGRETLFVNASIMTLRYRPKQAPWVVDLALPTGD